MTNKQITERLEYLRQEIKNETISQGEICELQSLAEYIDEDDVLLLEWAGVPECDCNKNYGNKNLEGSHDIDCTSRTEHNNEKMSLDIAPL